MTGPDLYISPKGKKVCRACNQIAVRRYAASLKALVSA
jgi:hypothetical protein